MEIPLNVCLLNDSFPPSVDGVSNTVLNYARIIQSKYGNSIVATPQYPNVKDEYSFPVVRYPSIDTTKIVGYRTGLPFNIAAMRDIEKFRVDILHSHCPMISTLVARTLREKIDAPLILTYHTKFDIDIAKALEFGFLQTAAIRSFISNIAACDDVWVVSRGAGENLKSLGYAGEYTLMENGVDFPKGRVQEDELASLKRECSIDGEGLVLLFVGRMMWYKGIDIILNGIAIAKKRDLKLKMIFVGDGTDFKEIDARTKELGLSGDVIFTGIIRDRELLRRYFSCADVFLFPSVYDTNGIVVREAAACGTPSMLIKGSCAAEGITDGRTGFLIDENAEALAASLIIIGQNPKIADEVGCRAMEEVYLSWEDSVGRAYERYLTVLDDYKAGGRKHLDTPSDKIFSAAADVLSGLELLREGRLLRKDKKVL